MYSEKGKGVVTRKDGEHIYIRHYGDSISTSAGIDADKGEYKIIGEDKNIEVGDFVSSVYYQNDYEHFFNNRYGNYGHEIEKIEPTEEDIKANELHQKYLDEVAKNGEAFYRDLLYGSKEIFETDPNPWRTLKLKTMELPKSEPIVLSDEKIEEFLEKYVYSIKTYGINGGSGSLAFGMELQLGSNNHFEEGERYNDYFGSTSNFGPRYLPSCVSDDYNEHGSWSGGIGSTKYGRRDSYTAGCYGVNMFRVTIDKEEVKTTPYVPGTLNKVKDLKLKEIEEQEQKRMKKEREDFER